MADRGPPSVAGAPSTCYGHRRRLGMRRSRRIGSIGLMVALALVLGASGCGRGPQRARNVVLISLDTTRADHLGCYGSGAKATPHLDALASAGVRFEHTVSPVPITLAAHSSLLTGMIPPVTGVHDNMNYRLRPDVTTLAELLANQGMETAGFVSAFVLDHRFGLAQGFGEYDDTFDNPVKTDFGVERRGSETAEHAERWLKGHATKPFFLFLHLYDPHAPYDPPEPFASRFGNDPYSGEIAAADAAVGSVLATLDELGVRDQTLVVVVGDHGEMLGDHGEPTHTYFVYEKALEVPLIVAGPGVPKGEVVHPRVGLIDVVPTVCGLLGIAPPAGIQGRDLSTWVHRGAPEDDAKPYYCESVTPTRYGANPLLGMMAGRWKYIRTSRPELYDLATDPKESNNLFDARHEAARRLQRALTVAVALRPTAAGGSHARLGSDEEAKLRSLGYLGGEVADDLAVTSGLPDPKDLIGLHADNQHAIEAISDGRLDEAEQLCRKILAGHPDFREARMSLARIAMKRSDWSEAVRRLRDVIHRDPRQYSALYDLGVALTHLDRKDEAVEAFRKAVPLDPEPPKARINLARALRGAGHFEEAVLELTRAVQAEPADIELAIELAELEGAAGKLGEARTRLEALARKHPDNARALFDLAQVRLRLGDDEGALQALRSMLATAPGKAKMQQRVVGLLRAEGRGDLLERLTGAAPEQKSEAPSVEHATALARAGRLDEAEVEFQQVLRTDPDNAGAWLNLGMIALQRRGLPAGLETAVPRFQKAVELAPSMPEARFNYGMALASSGRTDEARTQLETGLQLARSQGREALARKIQDGLDRLP